MRRSMGHLASKLQEIGGGLHNLAKNHEADEDFNDSMMKQHIANEEAESRLIAQVKRPSV
ncbi:hypothetical protein ACWIG5_13480 [Streptomyces lydicus]